ncbi:hypothetical protein DL771_002139 [Monosporascus sp. 5C6A]|nr:hypothetical protein DL771_002139 [Monosporascus sp. 5C6A]
MEEFLCLFIAKFQGRYDSLIYPKETKPLASTAKASLPISCSCEGIPVKPAIENGKGATESAELFEHPHNIANDQRGRIDIVENRFSAQSLGVGHNTPGFVVACPAHLDLDGLAMGTKVREINEKFLLSLIRTALLILQGA